ncbi:piggyBac transposable element-derived protein 4 isoform X3 [Halictus rubicundus]|uniref:piggyBac transposable element-derived protein 4 isoform X3 n=1 Tax=Halictus rubicundus TaxID=77578 RepID=UPI004036CF01
MASKRKFSTDDGSEKCAFIGDSNLVDTSDNNSDSSNIVSPVRKRPKQLITEDDTDDELINRQLSERWFWKEENNKPKIWKYTQTPGIRVAILDQLGESKRELDVFDIMFDNVFWENIVTETNRYAERTIINENERRKIDESWTPVDCNEIKIYFALCIIMAQVKKPNIQMNWSKRAVIETPIFRKTMPLQRFLQITRFLHFSNNDTTDNMDKLRKVNPVINFFNKKFKEVYVMEDDIAIYESLMTFKGRVSSKQFSPSKRTRFGIKFSKLCESASSYCYDFQIYSEFYDEWCILENPYFYVNDIDCWPCSVVKFVPDLTGHSIPRSFNPGMPYTKTENFSEIHFKHLKKLFWENCDTFERDAMKIYSNNHTYKHIRDVMESKIDSYPSHNLDDHITWRVNRMTAGRILRKLFPVPVDTPTWWEQSTEKFVIIDEPKSPPYTLNYF